MERNNIFYRGKRKTKVGINKLKVEGVVYEKAKDHAKILNESFQKVFTVEG